MTNFEIHIIKDANVGNVTQVASNYLWLPNSGFTETFTYDASDQLVSASETNSGSYQLAVSYGNWGKINSYSLAQTDLQSNITTQASRSITYPTNTNSLGNSQTMFAPTTQNGVEDVDFTFGINGSLRRREVSDPQPYTEYYLFNSAANMKAYSNNGLDVAYYGYNASNTRTYKLSFLNTNQWVNGQPEPFSLQLQSAMFYPNAYVNFNHNGEYTKHYYNGAERIASRLGITATPVSVTANARLSSRSSQLDNRFQEDIWHLVPEGVSASYSGGVNVSSLESPTGTASDIYYYHTNHLGSTAFVTDQSQTVTQGFLYAPFGEITTEYNANFGNDVIPKYSFNAKELDEETGMYYYEARYYKPPVFTSRDAMFEKYFWMTPYAYCANNPVKYVDPTGCEMEVDDYKIDKQGNISLLRKTDDNFDVLYNEDESSSIKVDKGILNKSRTNTVPTNRGIDYTFDQYEIIGDNKATKLFEFVSNNSNVEWSLTSIGANSGEKGKNILTTSHIVDSEVGGGYLKSTGYTIRKHSHSHPYNNKPSKNDLKFAESLNQKFPKATLDIYYKGKYYQYDKNGLIPIHTITLPAIKIETNR